MFVCVLCALQTALDNAKERGKDAVVAFLTEFMSGAAAKKEEAAKKKAEEEAAAKKKKAEEEAAAKKKKAEEEAAAKKKAEEEAAAMGIDYDMIKAARNGKLAEVQRLIGRGANVNAKDSVCSRLNT